MKRENMWLESKHSRVLIASTIVFSWPLTHISFWGKSSHILLSFMFAFKCFLAHFTYFLLMDFSHTFSPLWTSHVVSNCWVKQSIFHIFRGFTWFHFSDGTWWIFSCWCFLQVFLQPPKLHPHCFCGLSCLHSYVLQVWFCVEFLITATNCTIKQLLSNVD